MQSRSTDTPADKPQRSWHVDKTISLAHIFTTLTAICALAVTLNKFDTRVSSLEQSRDEQKMTNVRQEKDVDDFKRAVREDYKSIDDKLQRLIERGKP